MKTLLASLSIIIFTLSANAQISLTRDDVLNLIGTHQTYAEDISDPPIAVDVGSAGENQFWDFSDVTFPAEQYTIHFIQPDGTPFFDEFPTANVAGRMSITYDTLELSAYTYIEATEDRMTFLGSASDFLGMVEIETDGDFAPLPITYGTEWMITRYDTMETNPAYTVVQVETVLAEIDGWGTVTVPAGTFECLRLQTNWTEVIYTMVDEVVVNSDTSIGSDFSWLSKYSFDVANFNFNDPNYDEADDLGLLLDIVTGNIVDLQNSIHHYTLSQNYPNPFNPNTMINYQLPMASDVELSVFNLLGQKVAILASGRQEAGLHQVEWDASGFATGIYYYQLRAGKYQEVKKMILTK
jgi:hypothetical protein